MIKSTAFSVFIKNINIGKRIVFNQKYEGKFSVKVRKITEYFPNMAKKLNEIRFFP